MCIDDFIRMMFTVDLHGNRGFDSRRQIFIRLCFENLWKSQSALNVYNMITTSARNTIACINAKR